MKNQGWIKLFRKLENYKKLLQILSIKSIAFYPLLAKITGSIKAGLLLSQLLYWWEERDDKEWIYKTIDEIKEETALSRYEQDEAIKKLKKLNIIKVELKGIPAKRHFQINFQVLISLLKIAKS